MSCIKFGKLKYSSPQFAYLGPSGTANFKKYGPLLCGPGGSPAAEKRKQARIPRHARNISEEWLKMHGPTDQNGLWVAKKKKKLLSRTHQRLTHTYAVHRN